jgi:hypothetical protein
MSFIILIRMNSGDLITIEDQPNDRVYEFEIFEEAEKWLRKSPLLSQDWEIIEVDI